MSLTGERGGQGGRLSSRAVEHIGCVILPEGWNIGKSHLPNVGGVWYNALQTKEKEELR